MSFEDELEQLGYKYSMILAELNKLFRQEVRKLGVRKNVIPVKYILTKEYISLLLEYPQFRRTWQRKIFNVYVLKPPRDDCEEEERELVQIQSYPNLGGVPVEEGPEVKVIVERIPRRKRQRKKNAARN